MSHFITGADHIQSDLTISFTPTFILEPVLSHRGKSRAQQFKDKRVIKEVCGRLKLIEQQRIKKQTEEAIGVKREDLKRKFKSYFNPKANGRSVSDFFDEEKPYVIGSTVRQSLSGGNRIPMNLKNLSQKMPMKLQLQKKYHSTLAIKMMSIKQCRQIVEQKQKWVKQRNTEVNGLTQSPNYCKMVYIIEKLREKSQNPIMSPLNEKERVKTSENLWIKQSDNRLAYRSKTRKHDNMKTVPDSPKKFLFPLRY